MFSSSAATQIVMPTLYGDSAHGKRKMWNISVSLKDGAGVIKTEHGYVDSSKVIAERVITVGKNIGKRNETTPFQQATNEMQAMWKKKKDAGYTEASGSGATATTAETTVTSATSAATTTTTIQTPLPMLAQDFNKRGKSIIFPCLAQRKLDGVRCVATANGLFSRNAKTFPHLQHIKRELSGVLGSLILDGELYSDTLTFQEVVGLVKKTKLKPDDTAKLNQIHLCVYDIIDTEKDNEERNQVLADFLATHSFKHIRPLESVECRTREDLKTIHDRYVAEGYEGLMLRNKKGKYRVNVRSTDLQKYKEFEDAEYKVVGYKTGEGQESGCVIWLCATEKGQEFAVRPRGTHEERAELLADADSYVGKKLTVRFQELTTDGIPRFPVGIGLRDYE